MNRIHENLELAGEVTASDAAKFKALEFFDTSDVADECGISRRWAQRICSLALKRNDGKRYRLNQHEYETCINFYQKFGYPRKNNSETVPK